MESFIFLGMNLNMWIVLLTILVVFGLMLFTKLPGDYVFMGSLVICRHRRTACERRAKQLRL